MSDEEPQGESILCAEGSEEQVIMMGNEILWCLGSEDMIDDLETFTYDSLYLQLFASFFPELELDKVQPGESPEEMAQNI